jgi:CheY-like chemotaxis protein
MHGGKINASSAGEGHGSTFYIDLPLYSLEPSKSMNIASNDPNDLSPGAISGSEKSVHSKVSIFNLVRGLSTARGLNGGKKNEPSLLNNRVILSENKELTPESNERSFYGGLKPQATLKIPQDKNGRPLLPSTEMSIHIPQNSYQSHVEPESMTYREEVDELEDKDIFPMKPSNWLDHLVNLLQTPGNHHGRKRNSATSKILPSASFLSTSSSNYSLPLFLKEKVYRAKPNMKSNQEQIEIPEKNLAQNEFISPQKEFAISHFEPIDESNYLDTVEDFESVVSGNKDVDDIQSIVSLTKELDFDNNGDVVIEDKSQLGILGENQRTDSCATVSGPASPSKITSKFRQKKTVRIELSELASKSSEVSPSGKQRALEIDLVKKATTPTSYRKIAEIDNGELNYSNKELKSSAKSWDKGLNILIVDDSTSNRKMLKKLLLSCKHTVYEARDGIECLELLDFATEKSAGLNPLIENVDVILMDDHMPRLEGPETVKLLKERGFTGLIYAVSGIIDQQEIDSFLKVGALAVFTKPLNVEALRVNINEHFDKTKSLISKP